MKKVPWMIVVCEWIWRAILVNLYWIAFTILGLGIFGFFPSSVAMFTIVRKWLRKDSDLPVWATFKQVYFKEWKRSNGIGLVFYSMGLFLFVDIRIAEQVMTGIFASFLLIILYILVFVLLLAVGNFFSIYVHYELSTKGYVKQSFLFTLTGLPSTIWIGAGLLVIGMLLIRIPGLIPFISGVAPAYWMMRVSLNRFNKLENRMSQS
ncbi:YesL family protein [Neobacillus niacini]|uniref:YesL family protein n=1 Tax=Neobacillus niacini TaxID=86668 RepID=UPI003000588F